MYIFDITNPISLVLLLAMVVLLIFLGKEIKKPQAPAISLIFFLILIIIHSIQLSLILEGDIESTKHFITACLGVDFVMIFISFIGYLWVDDIATRFYKKKSIDNSLDWFWDKV